MANHKSALKRARQSVVKRTRNRSYKTRVKTAVKDVRTAVENTSVEKAAENLKTAVSIIQMTASKGIIHRRRAARKVSRLARRVNALAASKQAAESGAQG